MANKIIVAIKLLAMFNMASEIIGGTSNSIHAKWTVQDMMLDIMTNGMSYNIIQGRPWLHLMQAALSTFQQVVKFHTPWGIREIRGEPLVAREIRALVVATRKSRARDVSK